MAKQKGYTIVVNDYPYSNHRTLAVARKAGGKIADTFTPSTKIELWEREDVDDVMNLYQKEGSGFERCAKELGLGPIEEWE